VLEAVKVGGVVNYNTDASATFVQVSVVVGKPGHGNQVSGEAGNKEGIGEEKQFASGLRHNGCALPDGSEVGQVPPSADGN
jgi:hypothetical protein